MTHLSFIKMVGTGNDFIVVDTMAHRGLKKLNARWPMLAKKLCDRHRGIGADGLLVIEASRRAAARLRIFNADGSEAEMCGNGARCVVRYLAGRRKRLRQPVRLETGAGVLTARVKGDDVTLQLTPPQGLRRHLAVTTGGRRITGGFVNTGVPHFVVPVKAINDVDVTALGRALRCHEAFAPRGTNVNFIQSDPRHAHRLLVRTYERGVEGETLACGTGITASAIIHLLDQRPNGNGGRQRQVHVQARSGDLLSVAVRMKPGSQAIEQVVLRGAAQRVFEGEVDV